MRVGGECMYGESLLNERHDNKQVFYFFHYKTESERQDVILQFFIINNNSILVYLRAKSTAQEPITKRA
jgi:hypothetical protein